jgi:hypothetical protein
MHFLACLCALILLAQPLRAESQPDSTIAAFSPHLAALAPFVGKTWHGEFADSTPETPKVDVQRWERILNGQGIRITHSVNQGEYGGESIIYWDESRQTLAYWYFTTAGFMSVGTLVAGEKQFSTREEITGDANGVTEVEGLGIRKRSGEWVNRTRYLQNGTWVEGHSITYTEAPGAQLLFR